MSSTGSTKLILAILCAVLGGCEEKPDPQYGWWRPRCVADHAETQMVVLPSVAAPGGFGIGGGLSMTPQTTYVCDRWEAYCMEGKSCDPANRPRY